MDELIREFNRAGVKYLLIGGQAIRLEGLPRFSMDWDFYVPPHDAENFSVINELLDKEFDMPLLPMGSRGENFVQTYQTRWGILQFHLGGPGFPPFEEALASSVMRQTEFGTPVRCVSGRQLLAMKQAANRPSDQQDIQFLLEKMRLGTL